MATVVERSSVVNTLNHTVEQLDRAFAFGETQASKIDRIYFVAHGSANRAMQGLLYWIEQLSPTLEVRRYFPSEFIAQDPPRLDERTLVFLASKSGTTPETVAAAEFLRDKPCRVIGFTLSDTSPLAELCPDAFFPGETTESFVALFMLMQAVVGGILSARDGWAHGPALLSSLAALPECIAQAAAGNDARARADAEAYQDDERFYLVASGPGFTPAYVFGVCILMEMLWLHCYPIEAAEFFHGPFEIVDKNVPLILILGEDPSRPLMERVSRFCDKHAGRVMVYDSKDYEMPGIAPEIRPLVAPYVLQAGLKRLSEHLSDLRGQPLSTRRYMWKMEY